MRSELTFCLWLLISDLCLSPFASAPYSHLPAVFHHSPITHHRSLLQLWSPCSFYL